MDNVILRYSLRVKFDCRDWEHIYAVRGLLGLYFRF